MAKVISVVSGKGGTGKSTFSSGLSQAMAKKGHTVLLIDLDIGLRSLDLMLGMENKIVFDIGDILERKCKIEAALTKHKIYSGLRLLCAPNSIEKSFDVVKVIDLIQLQKKAYDYIILDLPAGLGLSVMMSKALADLICIVTTPDPVTVRDAQKVCDTLASCCDIPFKIIINHINKTTMKTSGLTDLDQLLDTVGAPLLGVLKEDKWIMNPFGFNEHIPKATSETQKVFEAIADRIEDKYVPLIIHTIR